MTSSLSPGSQLDILSASDPAQAARWDALVSEAWFPDTYYRPGYVRAYEVEGHGRAVAAHGRCAGVEFLVPLLLRPICDLGFTARPGLQDAITAYGYGGLLPLNTPHPSEAQVRELVGLLSRWGRSNGIVSCMLRLHPLLEQEKWLKLQPGECIQLHAFGPTTAVEVPGWSEAALRKGRHSDLSVARKSLELTWSSRSDTNPGAPALGDALRLFRDLYEETMERLQAAAFYRFSPAYYDALADGLGEGIGVALAWHRDEPVGGSIFLADRRCAHYHLSATNEEGRKFKATTLLIREGIEWARRCGCHRLHLGGGVRGDDSLFDFKKSFGGAVYQYSFAGLVTDPCAYEELVAARRATAQPLRSDFFPAYRA